jgi:hypothetical protein
MPCGYVLLAMRPTTVPRVRRALVLVGLVILLAGPAALAFFAGGYFDGPRAVAAALAWAVVLLLALAGPLPLPKGMAGRVAVIGLTGLIAWSAASLAWAPLAGQVSDNVQRLLLYLGTLLAAVALLRDRRAVPVVEPVLALGCVVVIGYGLSERLVPGLIDLHGSFIAGGRLEQPLTYWNAEGLLAAIGFVLCVRIAGDELRPARLRVAAAAACTLLGTGVYLSYSRGAVVAVAIGLIVLLAAVPLRSQLRAAVLALVAGAIPAACAAALPGVAALRGSEAARVQDGVVMLSVLLVATAAAAWVMARMLTAERRGAVRDGRLWIAAGLPTFAAVAAGVCIAGLVLAGLEERAQSSERAEPTPARFVSVSSRRYEYWRVAVDAFAREPLLGVGAGGFRVTWRMERRVPDAVNELHSLELEMATELGLPGLLLLALFLGGIAVAARQALVNENRLAAGACAVCSAWLLHASIDWDWQMPAVTLPALVLAGGLLAASEPQARVPAVEDARGTQEREARRLLAVSASLIPGSRGSG